MGGKGMVAKTITRMEIAEAIANKVGLSKQRANQILETALEGMIQGLIKDSQLKISSFASFNIQKKKNRIGRNPKTGQEVMITPRKTVSFRASDILKNRVLKGARSS
jgi:integration host factor subunit alpha